MGDSGSLPLGGLLGWMALVSKQELVLPLIALRVRRRAGLELAADACTERTGGRRLFTCAPVHHGLQLYGGVFQRSARALARGHGRGRASGSWRPSCAMASLALLKVR